jgi:hypothetical protein
MMLSTKRSSFLGNLASHSYDVALWLVFTFLCVQWILALPRIPIFNYDEAFMVEPAWHLATSGKPASTLVASFAQHSPYGMNYPLFSTLLAAWIMVFGFDLLSVRLFPFFLTCAAGIVGILALNRMKLISGTRQALLLLILWMLTHPAFYASHHARPESLTIFVFSLIILTATFRTTPANLAALTALSALIPYCGLHMTIPALIGLAIAYLFKYCSIRQVASIAGGILLGGVSFYILYRWTGAWASFEENIKLVGGLSIVDRIRNFFSYGEYSYAFIQSHLFVLLPLILLGVALGTNKGTPFARLVLSVSAYCVVTMVCMRFVGNFYVWYAHYNFLVLLPLIVVYAVFIFGGAPAPKVYRWAFLVLLVLLLLRNNLAHSLSYSHLAAWILTDHKAVSGRLASSGAGPQDVVLGTEAAYMALRPKVGSFYSLFHVSTTYEAENSLENVLPRDLARSVTMIVTDLSERQQKLVGILKDWSGGEWIEMPIPKQEIPTLPRPFAFMPAGGKFFNANNFRVYRRLD